ncbi:EF-hand domain-containing protein [Rhizobium halophilum]|uniref:hypothetical protein n=1 Tax=Rhizobium halophilum TaxID=2846852 RepID=UPI001EFEB5C0|nr:hypothetical protein [Rhizobium halophilum]MCF6370683.1 hypothetical protein [Rhizobium halophilum]
MGMKKIKPAFVLGSLLSAAAIGAQTTAAQTPAGVFSEGADEVRRLSDDMFSRWDTNENRILEGDEFLIGLHQRWSGQDGTLNKPEYEESWNDWFVAQAPDFLALDQNYDGEISVEELKVPLTDADLRGEWQGVDDAALTPEEFWAGLNKVSDVDRSGDLDDRELEALGIVVAPVPHTADE